MYSRSKEATACLGCARTNIHGMGTNGAATISPTGMKALRLQPVSAVRSDESIYASGNGNGPPRWFVPLAVGVGGLTLVGGVLLILKKKGKL